MLLNNTLEYIAARIRFPLEQWPGNCHAVAGKILYHYAVPGRARVVRGAYLGPVHEDSIFHEYAGRGFPPNHSWLVLDDILYDPLRWAFTMDDYSMYRVPASASGDEYAPCRAIPHQPYKAKPSVETRDIHTTMRGEAAEGANRTINPGKPLDGAVFHMSTPMAFWLANIPIDHAPREALKTIYKEFIKQGQGALIPLDNRIYILHGGYMKKHFKEHGYDRQN